MLEQIVSILMTPESFITGGFSSERSLGNNPQRSTVDCGALGGWDRTSENMLCGFSKEGSQCEQFIGDLAGGFPLDLRISPSHGDAYLCIA